MSAKALLTRMASRKAKKRSDTAQLPRRLSSSELSALFRRLDANGDGELSISEFRKIANKLKYFQSEAAENAIEDVFAAADSDKTSSGVLNLEEFRVAYNQLYNLIKHGGGDSHAGSENVIRATRYGWISVPGKPDPEYIFEVYHGSLKAFEHKITYDISGLGNELSERDLFDELDGKGRISMVDLVDFTLEHVNLLILADSRTNELGNSGLMWWVDYCTNRWRKSEIESFCGHVGLPDTIADKLATLEPSDKRICFERGGASSGYKRGVTGVLSIYLQALHLKNIPVIRRDPVFARRFGLSYLSSRLVHFRPFLSLKRCHEYEIMSSLASRELEALWDDEFRDTANLAAGSAIEQRKECLEGLLDLPFSRKSKPKDVPMYLLSSSDLKQRPVGLGRDSLSLHLQSHGSEPMVLYSFRTCHPDQPDNNLKFIQQARSGVLGRITGGIWKKLLQVIAHRGTALRCGELDDTPFALCLMLITMVNSTSMETVQKLDDWLALIREGIEEVAVTKQSKHLESLKAMTKEVINYVETFNRDLEPFLEQYNAEGGRANFDDEYKERVLLHRSSTSLMPDGDSKGEGKHQEQDLVEQSVEKSAEKEPAAAVFKPKSITGEDVSGPYGYLRSRDKILSGSAAVLRSENIADLPIENQFQFLKIFARKNTTLPHSGSLDLFPNILNGYDSLEKRGTRYWLERLSALLANADTAEDRYHMCLDEKRNFWAFVLGIVSIATFPFAVMTGYFGMNFENMAAPGHVLTNDYWPAFPGSDLIWILTIIVYGVMLLFMIHFNIFYSAS